MLLSVFKIDVWPYLDSSPKIVEMSPVAHCSTEVGGALAGQSGV